MPEGVSPMGEARPSSRGSTSAVSPLVMAAPMHARQVSQLLAIGDGGTGISPLLSATPLQKQTPFTNSLKRDPV